MVKLRYGQTDRELTVTTGRTDSCLLTLASYLPGPHSPRLPALTPMNLLTLAQATSDDTNNPLIAQGSEDAIYIALFLLAIGVTLALGLISHKLKIAILFALFLSAILIILITAF
jgi:hypothetical protein